MSDGASKLLRPSLRALFGLCMLTVWWLVPSSSRATDFIKLGSPSAVPVNLNGIASVYDRDPKAYEAWAVGEELDNSGNPLSPRQGVLLYYNGSYWTRVNIPSDTPPLNAVAAVRFLRTKTANNQNLNTPVWSSSVWAVGDQGAILHFDPYLNSWRVQKQLLGDTRGCTEYELIYSVCTNWVGSDLKTVAAASNTFALIGGSNKALYQYSEFFGHNSVTNSDEPMHDWQEKAAAAADEFGTNDEIRAITLIDDAHGWLAGTDGGSNGKLWRYAKVTPNLFEAIVLPGPFVSGRKFTSVAATLKKSSSTAGNPLSSIVWIGTENDALINKSYVYRYDQESGDVTTPLTESSAIRSLALARRAGGVDQNFLANGTFEADRKDSGLAGRYPDGWQTSSTYKNGFGSDAYSTALINGQFGQGKAFVGEPWQPRATNNILQSFAWGIWHPTSNNTNYPLEPIPFYQRGNQQDITLNSKDITAAIIRPLYAKNTFSGLPFQVGLAADGYIKVPSNTSQVFKVESPFGRAGLYIENDIEADAKRCFGGNNASSCTTDNPDCGGGICLDPTALQASSLPTPWAQKGVCSNSVGGDATRTFCYDNSECQWGSCSNDSSIRCRKDSECGSSPNVCQLWSNSQCIGASPIQAAQATEITLPANGGIKARVCANAPSTSCVSDEQCSGSGPCQVLGDGWYPFKLVYFQANSARCVPACVGGNNAGEECSSNSQCNSDLCVPLGVSEDIPKVPTPCIDEVQCSYNSGGTCKTGKWCVGGVNQGKLCSDNTNCPGGECKPQYTGKCRKSDGNRVGPREDCQTDVQCDNSNGEICTYSTCQNSTNPDTGSGTPCVYYPDYNTCTTPNEICTNNPLNSVPLMVYRKEAYLPDIPTNWTLIPNNEIMYGSTDNRSFVRQEMPDSNRPGVSYQVSGNYKIEFNREVTSLVSPDPRRAASPKAGVRTKCTKNNQDACGYDNVLFQSNPAIGVTNGKCNVQTAESCKTDQDCVTKSAGTICNANWASFSTVITKQDRNPGALTVVPIADDPAQSLVVECFADYGARISCDNLTVAPVLESAEPKYDLIDVWAVGDNGLVYRNSLDLESASPPNLPSDAWQRQAPDVTFTLRSIHAADPFHLWTVGDRVVGENAVMFNLSPGNIKGYGWIGASTNQNDPIGWIDFSCSNQGSCSQQPTTFGVDVGIDVGKCRKNLTKSCLVDGECGADGSCDKGVMTGSAWLGTQDPTEVADFGKCQNLSSGGTCNNGVCSNNSNITCEDNAPCLNTQCSTTCIGNSNILCSNRSQCFGTCENNQGFRCLRDSDCQVNCATNPLACRSTGWLSFDKSITGLPPAEGPYSNDLQSYIARFDSTTSAIDGWARLQLGQCSISKQACFQSAACPSPQTCDYSSAYPGQGWVKLRGGSSSPSFIFGCSACTPGATAETGTCKICAQTLDAGQQPINVAYNQCSVCTLKRCSVSLDPCQDTTECGGSGGECKPYGFCNFDTNQGGEICFGNDTCNDGPCRMGGACNDPINSLNSCTIYNQFGASIDTVTTKQFAGSAWSPDLGWIDLSRVRIGGQLFFATQFGSIYAGGNIGSSTTTPAPGFPGGTAAFCNATYRIIATGTITNFCSNAQLAPPAGTFDPRQSPYIYPQYPTPFIFPSAENRYTSQIGTLDLDGLTTSVGGTITRNKYGNPVVTVDKDPTRSDEDIDLSTEVPDMECDAGPCPKSLLGKVYHIKGNLIIDKNYRFDFAGSPTASGSGTFVIDGKLILRANIYYYEPQPGDSVSLSDRRQLPSVAFLVKSSDPAESIGIEINPAVTSLVGVYYTEKTVEVASGGSDNPLTVSGLMVAQNFRLERKYVDPSGIRPAELVIYDGRLQANTPPGLEFLSKGLPNVQEFAP